jgi:stearoyl-CoA desaturase (delta-9 desaturase)
VKKFSDFNSKIRILQLINHCLVAVGIIAVMFNFIDWTYILIGIISYVIVVMFGTCIGLHRYFSHRSFQTNRYWEYILAFLGTISTVGTILGWVGLHRYHHAHTDKIEDPHSPHDIGYFNAWFYNWKPSKFTKNFIKIELRDPMIIFMHKHYFSIIFLYIGLLLIINPWLVIWCYSLPACGSYLAISAVTVLGHVHGYKNYDIDDTSKNSWITSLLSLGEGWHNNHHTHPGNYRQGHTKWELDPSAWIIKNIIMKK